MAKAGSPGLREQKKLETWRALRQAALALIAERGFDAVSIDDIAAAARVSKSTLFNYFKTKEAILFDPEPEEAQQWQHLLDTRPEGEPVWASLEAFWLGYLGQYEAKLLLHKQLIAAHPSIAEAYGDSNARVNAFLLGWVQARLETRGHPAHLAPLLTQIAQTTLGTAFAQWDASQGFPALLALIRQHFQVVGRGLLTA